MALALVSPPPAWLAMATGVTGTTLTTAAFTPPAGALLLDQSMFDTATSTRTETTTTVTGSTSAWTKLQHQVATNGLVDSNWATVTSSVSTTVRTTWSATNDGALAVFVLTGQHGTTPIGQSGKGAADASGVVSFTVTPTTPGSMIFVSYASFNGGAIPSSTQLTSYGSSAPNGTFYSGYSAPLSSATTITLSGGGTGGASAAYNWVEVVPAAGAAAPGAGTATGAWSFVGTSSGKRTPKATASGSWSFVGTATGKRVPKASGTGIWTFTGTGTGKRLPKATGAGTWAFVGTSTGARPAAAVLTGPFAASFATDGVNSASFATDGVVAASFATDGKSSAVFTSDGMGAASFG